MLKISFRLTIDAVFLQVVSWTGRQHPQPFNRLIKFTCVIRRKMRHVHRNCDLNIFFFFSNLKCPFPTLCVCSRPSRPRLKHNRPSDPSQHKFCSHEECLMRKNMQRKLYICNCYFVTVDVSKQFEHLWDLFWASLRLTLHLHLGPIGMTWEDLSFFCKQFKAHFIANFKPGKNLIRPSAATRHKKRKERGLVQNKLQKGDGRFLDRKSEIISSSSCWAPTIHECTSFV